MKYCQTVAFLILYRNAPKMFELFTAINYICTKEWEKMLIQFAY